MLEYINKFIPFLHLSAIPKLCLNKHFQLVFTHSFDITVVLFEFGSRGCTYISFFTHSIHPFSKHTFLLPILSLYQVRISKRNRSTNFPTSFGSQKQAMQLFHTLTQTHLEADDKHSYEHSYGFYRKSFSTNLFRSLLVPVEFICPRVVVLS